MDFLGNLVTSGRIVDLVLIIMFVELVVSTIVARRRGIALDVYGLAFNIGAGGSLALALRASLTDAGWQAIAGWLVCSLVFHVLDVGRRWQRARE